MRESSDGSEDVALEGAAAALPPVSVLPLVAKNLKRLRTAKGYSLARLAEVSGVSRAMLGQIELSRSAPTINVLWRISNALAVPFGVLLGAGDELQPTVLRREGAARLSNADGSFSSRPLFPFGQGPRKSEFYELRLTPRGRENAAAHPPGTVENLVVARGKLILETARVRHLLSEGDAMIFRADGPHSYTNPGESETVIYLVMSYAVDTL